MRGWKSGVLLLLLLFDPSVKLKLSRVSLFLFYFLGYFRRFFQQNEALCDGPVDPAAWDAIMEKIVAEGFGHQDVRFAFCSHDNIARA